MLQELFKKNIFIFLYIYKSRRGKNKNLTPQKSNSNTVWFDYIRLKIKPNSVRIGF
jgi:hypothetical protein